MEKQDSLSKMIFGSVVDGIKKNKEMIQSIIDAENPREFAKRLVKEHEERISYLESKMK